MNAPDYPASDLTATGVSAGEQLQQQVPDATVVEALNGVFTSGYADPTGNGQPPDELLAGDDVATTTTLSAMVASLGGSQTPAA